MRALQAPRASAVYLLVVAAGTAALVLAGPAVRAHVLHRASTDLDNLAEGRLHVLVTSALVVAPPVLPSLLVDGALLLGGEALLGARRAATAFAVGHVGATLAVAGLLAVGRLPGVRAEQVRAAVDVGLSYGALGVAGCALGLLPGSGLRRAGATVLAVTVVAAPLVLRPPTFSAWGHLLALGLGSVCGSAYRGSPGATTMAP